MLVVARHSWRIGKPPGGEAAAADSEVAETFESILADRIDGRDKKPGNTARSICVARFSTAVPVSLLPEGGLRQRDSLT